MTTEQGSEMNQTEKQALKAYKDTLRTIVSLVAPPPRAMHEERFLAVLLLTVMFGVAITALWYGAWQSPVALVAMILGTGLVLVAFATAAIRRQGDRE